MSLPHPSLDVTSNSPESIRASVFDACLQLGALDDNNLIAEWMFNDLTIEGDNSLCRQNPSTRFKEMISSECLVVPDSEIPDERRRRRVLPFSIRAPTFTKRLSRPKSQPTTNEGLLTRKGPLRAGGKLNRVSISRNSLFKRTVVLSKADERMSNTVVFDDGVDGRVSTHPRTFFQRKSSIRVPSQADALPPRSHRETHPVRIATSSIDTPIHSKYTRSQVPNDSQARTVQEDDVDSDWEEIEAIPDPPLYPLPNEGMNPSAVFPSQTRSQRQPTRTIDSDHDTGIVHDVVRHKFALAIPRVLFGRPSKQGHHSLSSQRRRSSSSLNFTISSSSKQTKSSVKSSKSSSTPRKQSRMKITKGKHFRSRSDSLSPSPFVLLTSRDHDVDPAMPTTQIVFSSETPPRPASGSAIEAQTSCSMGYHHQFFVKAQEEAFKTSLDSPIPPIMPVWRNS